MTEVSIPAGLRERIREGDGIITVKEQKKQGKEIVFLARPDLSFLVPPGLPSKIKVRGVKLMRENWGQQYHILSANMLDRRTVSIIIMAKSLEVDTKPPGWTHRGPPRR